MNVSDVRAIIGAGHDLLRERIGSVEALCPTSGIVPSRFRGRVVELTMTLHAHLHLEEEILEPLFRRHTSAEFATRIERGHGTHRVRLHTLRRHAEDTCYPVAKIVDEALHFCRELREEMAEEEAMLFSLERDAVSRLSIEGDLAEPAETVPIR